MNSGKRGIRDEFEHNPQRKCGSESKWKENVKVESFFHKEVFKVVQKVLEISCYIFYRKGTSLLELVFWTFSRELHGSFKEVILRTSWNSLSFPLNEFANCNLL